MAASLLLLGAAGCAAGPRAQGGGPAPLDLAGRRVLVLPARAAPEFAALARRADAELAFALEERGAEVAWVLPGWLRDALARSPGLAPDPAALPDDPRLDRGDAPVGEALGSVLRRYAALADVRLVVLPLLALPAGEADSILRLQASVVDARTGTVIWRGGAERAADGEPAPAALAELAAAWAERLVAAPCPERAARRSHPPRGSLPGPPLQQAQCRRP